MKGDESMYGKNPITYTLAFKVLLSQSNYDLILFKQISTHVYLGPKLL